MNARIDPRAMVAETLGVTLLKALVTEIKLMKKPWDAMTQNQQDDVIDRLRGKVRDQIQMAVHIIASAGRAVVPGTLDTITVKDGAKMLIKMPSLGEHTAEIIAAEGKTVMVIIADSAEYMAGLDSVKGEPDQRAMDLGHEYHDNDGGGMEEDAPWRTGSTVIEGETLALPVPVPEYDGDPAKDPLYRQAVQVVIVTQKTGIAHLQDALRIGYNRAAILLEQMEKDRIVGPIDPNGGRAFIATEAAIKKIFMSDDAQTAE